MANGPIRANGGVQAVIVHAAAAITLVGGAPAGPIDLAAAVVLAPDLVAVDGGADLCRAAGMRPRAVIGDLDSISEAARQEFADRLIHIQEQETTDFDKALRHVAARLIIAVGFSGGRLDHELAVLNALVRHAGQSCIVLGRDSICFLCPPRIALDLPAGLPVSLFPMSAVRSGSQGLAWPTDGLLFRPDGRIGTSNAAAGGTPVILFPDRPALLAILPRSVLTEAATALQAAPPWPPG